MRDSRSTLLGVEGKIKLGWRVYFGCLLIALSAFLYLIHYLLFHDVTHAAI